MNNLNIKTINLLEKIDNKQNHLFKPYPDSIDYKKLTLSKLRSIVVEKELVADSSKLKKNELLKLLGAE